MPQRVLLDTHVLLHWLWRDPRLSDRHRRVCEAAGEDAPLWLSEVTLWEIAMLYSLRRIRLDVPLRDFLEQATSPPLVQRVRISPAIAAEVAALPDSFHRDPADRLIVASARVLGATLLTQDAKIIDAKLVPTMS
jgi:PIN domain nuclease of toxin-antitoxin system